MWKLFSQSPIDGVKRDVTPPPMVRAADRHRLSRRKDCQREKPKRDCISPRRSPTSSSESSSEAARRGKRISLQPLRQLEMTSVNIIRSSSV
ncbi:hypothetical protein AVEN_222577-1 [Araneus ventricosus]|uniref:Uncharacterized protein n=1 Tax=Araneus ventricosus TaxID=182803 RepID=A0A4Y2JM59_ARAVE|nr:hypothetical protein AVEN_222577-1 [Araneus ventricosus]